MVTRGAQVLQILLSAGVRMSGCWSPLGLSSVFQIFPDLIHHVSLAEHKMHAESEQQNDLGR